MRLLLVSVIALAGAVACATTQEPPGPAIGKWKNELNGANLNADYCVKEQTTFADFFLGNQAVGTATCTDASFYQAEDGALMGAAKCSAGAQAFVVHIRITGDLSTSYSAQSVMAPLSAKPDFSQQPAVVSTRVGDC